MWSKYASVESMPPGYRFAPTDEELIFYLTNKVLVKSVPGEAVRDIEGDMLYSHPPYAIVEDPRGERGEWYFFVHHDKYAKKQKEKENIPVADFWTSFGQEVEVSSSKKEAFQERTENGNLRNNYGNCIGKEFKEKQEKGYSRMSGNWIKEEQVMYANWTSKGEEEIQQEEEEKDKVRIVGDGVGFWRSVGKERSIYDATGNVFAFKIHLIYFSGSIRRGKKTHWRMEEYHLVARRGEEQDLKKEEWVLGRITRGRDYS